MIDVKELLSRHEEMRSARKAVEPEWRELARLFQPDDVAMFDGDQSGRNRVEDLFDSTQIYALEDFSSGLFSQMANPANRWFTVAPRDKALLSNYAVAEWCYRVSTLIGQTLSAQSSRFYEQAPGWFSDLGLYGIGMIYSEEVVGTARFRDVHVPLSQLFIDVNDDGDTDNVHRAMTFNGRRAKQKYPEIENQSRRIGDKDKVEIIHAVIPNPEPVRNNMTWRGKPWLSIHMLKDGKEPLRWGGYWESPYHGIRWRSRPGRPYPSGPASNARPDASMLQEMERTHLVAAQFAAEPPLLAMDNADIVPADISPNAILNGGMTPGGRQALVPLNRAQNLQLSFDQSNQRRDAIRHAMFFSMLSMLKRPQMTATEVNAYDSERLRQMAPYVESIQANGLTPLLARRFNILQRAGALPEAPPEMAGQPLQVEHVSPLAKLQQLDEARGVMNYIQGVSQIAQATGDVSVLDNIDTDKAAAVLHRTSGSPPDVRRDPQQIEKLRQGRAAAQQQQIAIEQQAQQVETAATASHAVQAQTSAARRAA